MAVGLSVEVRGLERLQATLDNLPAQIGRQRQQSTRIGGQQIVKFWKLQLSGPAGPRRLGVRSGALRASIHDRPYGGEGVIVGTDKPYAAIHEFGGKTKPHRIDARVGKFLRWQSGGETRFARFVNHPGSHIPRRPHRRPAVESVWPVLQALFAGNLDEAMRRSLEIGQQLGGTQWADAERLGPLARRR